MRQDHNPVLLAVLTLGLAAMTGCGGGPVALRESIKPDPAVKWIFTAGSEMGLVFWVFPTPYGGGISGGSVADDRLILLCNLGTPTELLLPCRAYVLDIETGKVLRSIAGPSQSSSYDWMITPKFAYVKDIRKNKYVAFDLERGCLLSRSPLVETSVLDLAPQLHWTKESFDFNRRPSIRRTQVDLGPGRAVSIVEQALRPVDSHVSSFVLGWVDSQGIVQKRQLCDLPHRACFSSTPALFVDDDDLCIFSWSGYLICLDPKQLDGWSKIPDNDADNTIRRQKVNEALAFFKVNSRDKRPAMPQRRPIPPFRRWDEQAKYDEIEEAHINGLYWREDGRIPQRYREKFQKKVSFVIAIDEWVENAGYQQLRTFIERAGFRFFLRADGHEDILITEGHCSGTFTSGDGRFQGFLVLLDDAQLDKLAPSVEYTLVPSCESRPSKWKVNEGVRLLRP